MSYNGILPTSVSSNRTPERGYRTPRPEARTQLPFPLTARRFDGPMRAFAPGTRARPRPFRAG